MINTNIPTSSSISATKAKVDVYTDSALVTCTCKDFLQDFTLYREGDTSKFFGFGVSHKMAISLIDLARSINIQKGNTLEISLGDGENFDSPFPTLYITEVEREEKSNTITCTAFDALYKTTGHIFNELNFTATDYYTIRDLVTRCAEVLELEVIGVDDEAFDLAVNGIAPTGGIKQTANFAGDETLRVVLDIIAEATQTIYYINHDNKLVFKRLDKIGDPVLTVTKKMYYELTTSTPRTLTTLCFATELGNNWYIGDENGTTQVIRDNPLLTLRTFANDEAEDMLRRAEGITITQLSCDWEGNHCLEIGDKISVVTEDNETVHTYILDDVIEYQGFLNEVTSWEFTQDEETIVASPSNIGDKINQTFARVDKVNKRIDLVATDVTATKSKIAELQLTTDGIGLRVEKIENQEFDLDIENDANFIALKERVSSLEISDTEISAKVSAVEQSNTNRIDSLSDEITTLTQEVNLKLSSEDLTIAISKSLTEGVDKVVTSTKKYTFDDTGLNVGSSDSSISTTITEDGMRINRAGQEVLIADNEGVKAEDLHATTYLIIGENSRLEDWQNRYTACFWLGGNE